MGKETILLGPPGAGKGRQAQSIAREPRILRISTGDILRSAVAAGTEPGKTAKAHRDREDLVPDELMVGLITERVQADDCAEGVLRQVMAEAQRGEPPAPAIDVPEEELTRRVSGRPVCRGSAGTFGVTALPEGAG